MKTDQSKHNICIASIKRSTIQSYDFTWTRFYESNADFLYAGMLPLLQDNELVICSTVINVTNYSILTTRRLVTNQDGQVIVVHVEGASDKLYGDFKGSKEKPFTFGQIQLKDGTAVHYFIETGKASMVMIHGIRTLLRIQ